MQEKSARADAQVVRLDLLRAALLGDLARLVDDEPEEQLERLRWMRAGRASAWDGAADSEAVRTYHDRRRLRDLADLLVLLHYLLYPGLRTGVSRPFGLVFAPLRRRLRGQRTAQPGRLACGAASATASGTRTHHGELGLLVLVLHCESGLCLRSVRGRV